MWVILPRQYMLGRTYKESVFIASGDTLYRLWDLHLGSVNEIDGVNNRLVGRLDSTGTALDSSFTTISGLTSQAGASPTQIRLALVLQMATGWRVSKISSARIIMMISVMRMSVDNSFWGRGGNDNFYLNGGNDKAYGGAGNDYFVINLATDSRTGSYHIEGGAGNDSVIAARTASVYYQGGDGGDTLDVRQAGMKIFFDGGAGRDILLYYYGTSTLNIDLRQKIQASLTATTDATEISLNKADHANVYIVANYVNDAWVVSLATTTRPTESLTRVMLGQLNSEANGFANLEDNRLSITSEGKLAVVAGTALTGMAAGHILDRTVDFIYGTYLGDSMIGNEYVNEFYGYLGNDILRGMGGNDALSGNGGADIIDGGAGRDWSQYYVSAAAVTVSLLGQHQIAWAAVANVKGSALSAADAGKYIIASLSGSTWSVSLGTTSESESASKKILGKLDSTGLALDKTVFNDGLLSISGTTLSVAASARGGGEATGDKLISIESLYGSNAGNDTLIGNDGDNSIYGWGGNDTLTGHGGDDYLWGGAGADTLIGGAGDDILRGGVGADILMGGTGNDTLTYHRSTEGVRIFLHRANANGVVVGDGGTASLDRISGVENIIGSAYADRLTGNASDNIFFGLGGADRIDGGAGFDTITFKLTLGNVDFRRFVNIDSTTGVEVNLLTGIGKGGQAEGDRYANIEGVIGTDHADVIIGDSKDNRIEGGAGADRLTGGAGTDTLSYAASSAGVSVSFISGRGTGGDAAGDVIAGFEHLIGSAHNDTLIGDAGANLIEGGAGADRLTGGAGEDTLTYASAGAGVAVNLTSGRGTRGDAAGDVIAGFEHLIGSAYGDVLTGSAGANRIFGGAGNDVLSGGAGADLLYGGTGIDIIDVSGEGASSLPQPTHGLFVDLYDVTGTSLTQLTAPWSATNFRVAPAGGTQEAWVYARYSAVSGWQPYITRTERDSQDGRHMELGKLISGRVVENPHGLLENIGARTLRVKPMTHELYQDRFQSIEGFKGTKFSDHLAGGDEDNIFYGAGGDDVLIGRGGDDQLFGGAGDDWIQGDSGADRIDGGAGTDTLSYTTPYLTSGFAGVSVDLRYALQSSWAAAKITLSASDGGKWVMASRAANGSWSVILSPADTAQSKDLVKLGVLNSNATALLDGHDGRLAIGTGADAGKLVIAASTSGGGQPQVSWAASDNVKGSALGQGDALKYIILEKSGSTWSVKLGSTRETSDADTIVIGRLGRLGQSFDNSFDNHPSLSIAIVNSAVLLQAKAGTLPYHQSVGDVITGIEHLVGTNQSDLLTGDDKDNILTGLGGYDVLRGMGGDDRLISGPGRGMLDGGAGDDRIVAGSGAEVIEGGTGFDILDYSQSNAAVRVSLSHGLQGSWSATNIKTGLTSGSDGGKYIIATFSNNSWVFSLATSNTTTFLQRVLGQLNSAANGLETGADSRLTVSGTLSIARSNLGGGHATGDNLSGVEGVIGTSLADVLIGDAGDNYFYGARAGDMIQGLGGSDTAAYTHSARAVSITLRDGTNVQATASGGEATGDRLFSIENLVGSAHRDTLTGNSADNTLEGGAGADTLTGGAGNDTLSYAGSSAGVTVRLNNTGAATVSGGDATGDTATQFENITGSAHNDRLTGNNTANIIKGLGGNDILNGGAGSDLLDGGAGFDWVDYSGLTVGSNQVNKIDFNLTTAQGWVNAPEHNPYPLVSSGPTFYVIASWSDSTNSWSFSHSRTDGSSSLASHQIFVGSYRYQRSGQEYTYQDVSDPHNLLSTTGTHLGANFRVQIADFTDAIGDARGDRLKNIEAIRGSTGSDHIVSSAIAEVIDGHSGTDTADYSKSSNPVSVNLGHVLQASWKAAKLSLTTGANGDGNKLVMASRADDGSWSVGLKAASTPETNHMVKLGTLNANATALVAGHDSRIAIGTGADAGKLVISASTLGGGYATGDSLIAVENLIGTSGNDTLIGTSGANIINGGAGADILTGGGGNDVFIVGASTTRAGADTITDFTTGDKITLPSGTSTLIYQKSGADTWLVTPGNTTSYLVKLTGFSRAITDSDFTNTGLTFGELVVGTAGNDSWTASTTREWFDGLGGRDTVSYASSDAAVTVNLGGTKTDGYISASGGHAANDRLKNIENITGSAHADTLTGDAQDNTLIGGAGNDTLSGGAGNDILVGGAGADDIDGGAGFDTADYSSMTLSAGQVNILSLAWSYQINFVAHNDPAQDFTNDNRPLYFKAIRDGNVYNNFSFSNADSGTFDAPNIGFQNWRYVHDPYGLFSVDSQHQVRLTSKTMAIGDAAGDRLRNIEKLIASSGSDLVHAGGGHQITDGHTGNDTISYAGSNASVKLDLNFVLQASWTAGTITLNTGNDGDGGKWVMAERASNGTWSVSLKAANSTQTNELVKLGVVNSTATGLVAGHDGRLAMGTGSDAGKIVVAASTLGGGDATGDSILNFENLTGSRFDDTLTGDAGVNHLIGGYGNDTLNGGAGGDILDGGAGDRDVASYASANSAVRIDMAHRLQAVWDKASITLDSDNDGGKLVMASRASDGTWSVVLRPSTTSETNILVMLGSVNDEGDGLVSGHDTRLSIGTGDDAGKILIAASNPGHADANGDIYRNIEGVVGTSYDDLLIGGSGNDVLYGGAGDDVIIGGAGADDMDGGAGFDTVDYSSMTLNAGQVNILSLAWSWQIDFGRNPSGYRDSTDNNRPNYLHVNKSGSTYSNP